MGALARAARTGISQSQRRGVTSLARDGRVSAGRLGPDARRGARVAGTGLPPQAPALLMRRPGPMVMADAGGVNAFHANPTARPPVGRHVSNRPQAASRGYAGPVVSRATGAARVTGVVSDVAGRFRNGSATPVAADSGYGPSPRPSGGASAPRASGDMAAGRFVSSSPRPASFGPAGNFA